MKTGKAMGLTYIHGLKDMALSVRQCEQISLVQWYNKFLQNLDINIIQWYNTFKLFLQLIQYEQISLVQWYNKFLQYLDINIIQWYNMFLQYHTPNPLSCILAVRLKYGNHFNALLCWFVA